MAENNLKYNERQAMNGFSKRPEAGVPLRRPLVEKPDLRLDHWSLPPASLKNDGYPKHHLSVQVSSGVRFNQLLGRQYNDWMPAGSSWITPAGVPNEAEWARQSEVLVLSFLPSLYDRVLEGDVGGTRRELVPRIIGTDPFIADLVHLLARSSGDEPFGSLLQDGLTVSLLAYLARVNAARGAPKIKSALTRHQLARVIEFVENHLDADISLAALAAEAGLSERYFCTAFGQTIGTSPYRYVIERRIEKAKALLQSKPMMSITDIAQTVGFSTSTHFATMFRNLTGVSPSSFRADRR